jgi:hypothetical protein
MSISGAETYLKTAKQQLTQKDINESLIRAIAEVIIEVKQITDEIRRVRREVQMARRF